MVRKLISGSGLNLKQAEDRYHSEWDEFEAVKYLYSGLFATFRETIKPRDKLRLVNCIETLLLLSTESPVQRQAVIRTPIPEETLHYRIRELAVQIFEYVGNFRESKKERLGVRPRVYPLLVDEH